MLRYMVRTVRDEVLRFLPQLGKPGLDARIFPDDQQFAGEDPVEGEGDIDEEDEDEEEGQDGGDDAEERRVHDVGEEEGRGDERARGENDGVPRGTPDQVVVVCAVDDGAQRQDEEDRA